MCRIAPTVYSKHCRVWTTVRRFWSRVTDLAFLGMEIAYYPLLVFGIVMILWAG